MLLAPYVTQYFLRGDVLLKTDIYENLGLKTSGLIEASIVPLILTAILFLGPLTMQFLSGTWKLYTGMYFL